MEFRGRIGTNKKLDEKKSTSKTFEEKQGSLDSECTLEKLTKGKKKKSSFIPKLRTDRSSLKTSSQKSQLHWQGPSQLSSPSNPSLSLTPETSEDAIEKKGNSESHTQKTKANDEKYYGKLENLLNVLDNENSNHENHKNHEKHEKTDQVVSSTNLECDKSVEHSQSKPLAQRDTQYVLENTVRQITEIWKRASNEVSDSLKNLPQVASSANKDDSLMKIDLAIKQAKSLTLIKTREALVEAKKLIENREAIRKELEKLMNIEADKMHHYKHHKGKCNASNMSDFGEKNACPLEVDRNKNIKEKPQKELEEENTEKLSVGTKDSNSALDNTQKDITKSSGEPQELNEATSSTKNTSDTKMCECLAEVTDYWEVEIGKKNETISHLNSKIFELQKMCHENTIKFSRLQSKIEENQEKIKWDQVLWKQVGKLKKEIRDLKEANKQLEDRNAELNYELQRQAKINQRLTQANNTLTEAKEASEKLAQKTDKEKLGAVEKEKVLAEKQSVIEHLKTILKIMKDQENIAQKQIELFQAKIQELQNSTLT